MRWSLTSALCCLVALPALSNTLGDFDGDGKHDVLLRMTLSPGSDVDRAAGAWAVHLMDGATVRTGAGGTTEVTQDWAWRLAGIGDFNGDGKSDLMLRHFDGRFSLQAMNGRQMIAAESGSVDIDAGLDWHVEGIGDFDGDGNDDMLLRSTERRWRIYAMDGRRVATRRAANLTRNRLWDVQGIGDLNGDGKDDVVLRRRSSGGWYAYLMDGHRFAKRGGLRLTTRATWRFAGMGDLNGDGKDDMLLRREDGPWYYYPMNGLQVRSGRGYADLSTNLDWHLAGVGDLDGDGRTDVLLRHVNGGWHFQAMNGRNPIVGRGARSPLTASRAWRVARPSPRIPPPPIDRDAATMNEFADAWREPEFGLNPGLSEMNAHWAYARGLTGEGETVGMVDTGLYALHGDRRSNRRCRRIAIDHRAPDSCRQRRRAGPRRRRIRRGGYNGAVFGGGAGQGGGGLGGLAQALARRGRGAQRRSYRSQFGAGGNAGHRVRDQRSRCRRVHRGIYPDWLRSLRLHIRLVRGRRFGGRRHPTTP